MDIQQLIKKVREIRDAQENAMVVSRLTREARAVPTDDPYMRGLYNGIELVLSSLEERDPVYKLKPN